MRYIFLLGPVSRAAYICVVDDDQVIRRKVFTRSKAEAGRNPAWENVNFPLRHYGDWTKLKTLCVVARYIHTQTGRRYTRQELME